MGSTMTGRSPAMATPDAPVAPGASRPSRQNVDEAIVVRWRDGIAIVELVSTVRRKHRRRTPAARPSAPTTAERVLASSDTQGDPAEESER
jgi:hypothetical protein